VPPIAHNVFSTARSRYYVFVLPLKVLNLDDTNTRHLYLQAADILRLLLYSVMDMNAAVTEGVASNPFSTDLQLSRTTATLLQREDDFTVGGFTPLPAFFVKGKGARLWVGHFDIPKVCI
jgi:hypothetical protein